MVTVLTQNGGKDLFLVINTFIDALSSNFSIFT